MTDGTDLQPTENGKFRVLFGREGTREVPENCILITSSGDRFDDFRFKTRIVILVRRDQQKILFECNAMIGFDAPSDQLNGADFVEAIVVGAGQGHQPPPKSPSFFTLLPDLQDYRTIVAELGVEIAREVLIAIHDLVALGEFQPASTLPGLAARTDVFNYSLVRTAEAYFAFKNAGPILRGLQHEEIGRISQAIFLEFKLPSFQNPHQLQFEFDHHAELPKRMAIIIGKNGVGKSQTLGKIADRALRGKGLLDPNTGERAVFNRMLAFAATFESLSVFPSERRRLRYVRYSRYALNRTIGRASRKGIADIIVRVVRSNFEIAKRSRWKIFLDAIEAIDDWKKIHLWTQDGDLVPLRTLGTGGELARLARYASINLKRDPVRFVAGKPLRLSSGEMFFLKFAALVSLEIENGSLLLFDEPETHLHPNFISRFVSILDRLLAETGSAGIIATHSSYFLREVFREQISILRVDEHRSIDIQRPRLATFGADVGEISYFVFGEDEPSFLAQDLEKRLSANHTSWDEIVEKYQGELSSEFLTSLKAKIEN